MSLRGRRFEKPQPQFPHGVYPPKGVLASYTDADGYISLITHIRDPNEIGVCGLTLRYGECVIIAPDESEVFTGFWMNWPEDEWGISKEDWQQMSWQRRALLEVTQQATAYAPLREQYQIRRNRLQQINASGCVKDIK